MKVNVDIHNRIVIPKAIRDVLNLNEDVYMYIDYHNNCIMITNDKRKDTIDLINKRLEDNITMSEYNFLQELKNNI